MEITTKVKCIFFSYSRLKAKKQPEYLLLWVWFTKKISKVERTAKQEMDSKQQKPSFTQMPRLTFLLMCPFYYP